MSRLRPLRLSRREELLCLAMSATTVYTIGRRIECDSLDDHRDHQRQKVELAIAGGLQRMWGAFVRRSRFRRKGAR
jgi:hypothetical protein